MNGAPIFYARTALTLSLTICFAIAQSVFAQHKSYQKPKYEYVYSAGLSIYFGDLAGASIGATTIPLYPDSDLSHARSMVLFGIRKNISHRLALRGSLSATTLFADERNSASSIRAERNLHFRTSIQELSGLVEYNLINFAKNKNNFILEYYVFGGLGLFHFNPKAKYKDEWVRLQPLGTEGQGVKPGLKKYRTVAFSFPIGAGLRANLNQEWTIFGELSFRATATDYLDDVSTVYYEYNKIYQAHGRTAADLSYRGNEVSYPTNVPRGNPESKDSYASLTLGVSKMFGSKRVKSTWQTKATQSQTDNCPRF
ncbi:MAG: hypothetical protein ACI8ZN_002354 [Bacteroidia bacterium]